MLLFDFVLIVVPLACIVAALTGATFYYARREEFEKHRRITVVHKFLKARSQQQGLIRRELEKVASLYENGNISQDTYSRLQNVLFLTQERLRYQASMLVDEKGRLTKKIDQLLVPEPELEKSLRLETLTKEEEKSEGKVEEAPPKAKKTSSKAKKNPPKVEETPPEAKEAAPEVKETPPEVKKAPRKRTKKAKTRRKRKAKSRKPKKELQIGIIVKDSAMLKPEVKEPTPESTPQSTPQQSDSPPAC